MRETSSGESPVRVVPRPPRGGRRAGHPPDRADGGGGRGALPPRDQPGAVRHRGGPASAGCRREADPSAARAARRRDR